MWMYIFSNFRHPRYWIRIVRKTDHSHACRSLLLTLPQALQWCRRSVRLKSVVQFMHIITWETGTSTGAASPKAIHNFSRACRHMQHVRHGEKNAEIWQALLLLLVHHRFMKPFKKYIVVLLHYRVHQMCRALQHDPLSPDSVYETSPPSLRLN